MWCSFGRGMQNGGLVVGTIIKPKLGLRPKPFGEACRAFWQGGDFIKNDEPQGNQVYCQTDECIPEVVYAMRVCIQETGVAKLFSANIIADDPAEMIARGKYILSQFGPLAENCVFLVGGYVAGGTEYGRLNALESVELTRLVVQRQRREPMERWLKADTLECTEELGDVGRPLEMRFALSIYLRISAHQKVTACFVEHGLYEQIVAYVKKVGDQAGYSMLLQSMLAVNPECVTNFAKSPPEGQAGQALIDVNQVVKVFMDRNRLQEPTPILLEAPKEN